MPYHQVWSVVQYTSAKYRVVIGATSEKPKSIHQQKLQLYRYIQKSEEASEHLNDALESENPQGEREEKMMEKMLKKDVWLAAAGGGAVFNLNC